MWDAGSKKPLPFANPTMKSIFINIKNTLVISLMGVFFMACGHEEFSKNEQLNINGKFPDEASKNIHMTFSDNGEKNFELLAPTLHKYGGENPYMDCPDGIKIISYSNNAPEAILTADYAISEENTMRMEAHYNVVITNVKQGDTIKTEKIIWDKKNKHIYSDVTVKQIRGDGTINIGDGFDADEKFSRYTVRNPRGEIIADQL